MVQPLHINPFAAEFGAKYDVLFTISVSDPTIEEAIATIVGDTYRGIRK
jgi:hypothetical protein